MPLALIIVDPQNDFGLPTGALYVPDGENIIPEVNALRHTLRHVLTDVIITQDCHPANHVSFAENNPGSKLFETIALPDGTEQVMWPVHCVQDTPGGDFLAGLVIKESDVIVKKGRKRNVDSYSGFGSPDGKKESTGLHAFLHTKGITDVIVVGLAFDYCVSYTARDAAKLGYRTFILRSATRGIAPDTIAKEESLLRGAGVTILESIGDVLKSVLTHV